MYTIISGTNRQDSHTLKIAKQYQQILQEKNIEAQLFSLEGVDVLTHNAAFEEIEETIISPTKHFIFITPEYNGSFPGVVKLLFDNTKNHKIWFNKTALLTGVSSGRAGNLRGMDHLADVLNYLKITTHPNKLPISSIDKLWVDGNLDEHTLNAIHHQVNEYLEWIKA